MNIGFIVQDVSLGGGERILSMLMKSFYKEGHSIILYTWNKKWNSLASAEKYRIVILDNYPNLGSKYKAFKSINKAFKENRPDCVITFVTGLAEVAVWAAKVNNIPFIMSERCDPLFVPDKWYHRLLEKIIYRNCDGLVFQTETVRKYFSMKIQEHSIVIPNPLIDDELPIADIDNSRKEIIGIGRLCEQKNFGVLIDAFAELNPDGYVLKIYGEGPLENNLKSKISAYHLEDKILLMGKVDRVVDEIVHSDIFVLSSIHEGMPNVLIESLAMGLACIAFDVPSHGARNLINDNINGLLIPVNDKELLKESLLYLIEHPDKKMQMKKAAIKIRQTNSQERIIPIWMQYIKTVITNYR